MRCAICQAESSVLETRDGRRRRVCRSGHRFTTVEVVVPEEAKRVNGYRDKLREGIAALKQQKNDHRLAIAREPGTLAQVAEKFGCSVSHVWQMRRMFTPTQTQGN